MNASRRYRLLCPHTVTSITGRGLFPDWPEAPGEPEAEIADGLTAHGSGPVGLYRIRPGGWGQQSSGPAPFPAIIEKFSHSLGFLFHEFKRIKMWIRLFSTITRKRETDRAHTLNQRQT